MAQGDMKAVVWLKGACSVVAAAYALPSLREHYDVICVHCSQGQDREQAEFIRLAGTWLDERVIVVERRLSGDPLHHHERE